jgi:hypothetical protein
MHASGEQRRNRWMLHASQRLGLVLDPLRGIGVTGGPAQLQRDVATITLRAKHRRVIVTCDARHDTPAVDCRADEQVIGVIDEATRSHFE